MTTSEKVTRRGFVAAVGVGAAATAIPAGALAAQPADGAAPLDALHLWYRRELERHAEELRWDFRAGKYRDHRDSDFPEDDLAPGTGWTGFANLPFCHLEKVAAERFGLTEDGDARLAYTILAVSPNVERIDPGPSAPYSSAREAVALDLLAVARSRGWYVPAADDEHQDLEVLS